MTAEDAAGAKRSVEVGFEDGVPLRFGKLQRGQAFGAARAVHQDMNAAELLARRLQQLLNAGVIGDVARQAQGLSSQSFDFGGGGADMIFAASRGYNIGAGLGESFCQGKADAAGAA